MLHYLLLFYFCPGLRQWEVWDLYFILGRLLMMTYFKFYCHILYMYLGRLRHCEFFLALVFEMGIAT